MHPLCQDLTTLDDHEVDIKCAELIRRVTQTQRAGMPHILHQLTMLLDDYVSERDRRQHAAMDKLTADSDETFNKIIDVS